jgi:thymidine phosphorylase
MASSDEAEQLARSLVEVANGAGLKTSAVITDMNQPLADAVGNALEIRNAIAFLAGEKSGTRLETVVLAFAAEMLVQSGVASSREDGEAQAAEALSSGKAADIFGRMAHMLGGPSDLMEKPDSYLPAAPAIRPVVATRSGWLAACNSRDIGMSLIDLGGGRRHPDDRIDHRVGFSDLLPLGTRVERGEPIAFVHAASEDAAEIAAAALQANYVIGDSAPALPPVISSRF